MLAIEAQDKELAKMLQEREKAKAKRAKERARLRKQQLQEQKMQQEAENAQNGGRIGSPNHPRSHSDPAEFDGDSYSDPIDCLPVESGLTRPYHNPMSRPGEYYHSKQSSGASRDSALLSDENYSNPIDLIKSTGGGSKKTSPNSTMDEIYISPADTNYAGPSRPTKLELRGPLNRPAAPK